MKYSSYFPARIPYPRVFLSTSLKGIFSPPGLDDYTEFQRADKEIPFVYSKDFTALPVLPGWDRHRESSSIPGMVPGRVGRGWEQSGLGEGVPAQGTGTG